jgi:protein TonB
MVVSSVSLHLAALGVVPSPGVLIEPLRPVLEVVLLRPPVPEPVVERPAAKVPKPTPAPPRRFTEIERAPRVRPAPPQPSQPILAVPESAAPVTESALPKTTVELPAAAAARPAPSSAPPQSSSDSVGTAPPSFNAAYLRNPAPRYPLVARRNGVEGTVRVKVLVTSDGRPAQVQLDQTSGSSALDAAALEAVREWRFVPARRGEERIESWVEFPVVFKLRNAS